MTDIIPPTGEMPDELNEIWRLEDRLNEEGKYTSFLFGSSVSLHGNYTAEDLAEILKLLHASQTLVKAQTA